MVCPTVSSKRLSAFATPKSMNSLLVPLFDKLEQSTTLAKYILDFFANRENLRVVEKLQQLGVHWDAPATNTGASPSQQELPLIGQTWVITGKLNSFTRDELSEHLQSLGAKVAGSVSKNTDCVVAGEKAGSKLKKAADLNVPVIDEAQLLERFPI